MMETALGTSLGFDLRTSPLHEFKIEAVDVVVVYFVAAVLAQIEPPRRIKSDSWIS